MRRIYYNLRRHYSNLCFRIRKRFNLPDPVEFKYIVLVFENCNTVKIPSRLVNQLVINDVRKEIFTTFCQQLITIDYCMEFSVTLKNEALNIPTAFQASGCDLSSSFEHHIKVYKDITHVSIKPNKGKEIYISTPYDTKDERSDINLLQINEFREDMVTISSKH